jgi:hypothetical protein
VNNILISAHTSYFTQWSNPRRALLPPRPDICCFPKGTARFCHLITPNKCLRALFALSLDQFPNPLSRVPYQMVDSYRLMPPTTTERPNLGVTFLHSYGHVSSRGTTVMVLAMVRSPLDVHGDQPRVCHGGRERDAAVSL